MSEKKPIETPRSKAKNRRRIRKILLGLIAAAALVGLVFLILFLVSGAKVKKQVEIEAGTHLSASDFYEGGSDSAQFSIDCPPFYYDIPGSYKVLLKDGWYTHESKLIVRDTTDPKADARNVTTVYGQSVSPEDFLENVEDATRLDISFAMEPDIQKSGDQMVMVCLKDLGGNETLVKAYLTIVPVYPELIIEAGSEPVTEAGLVFDGSEAISSLDLATIEYNHVGDYDTVVTTGGKDYPCHIRIVDTIPPILQAQDLMACVGMEREITDFVTELSDQTDVALSMQGAADYTKEGESELVITATDEGGNQSSATVKLTVEYDKEPPVFTKCSDFTSFQGETISYRNYVQVEDNSGYDVDLRIDASQVNQDELGTYPVTYTATDYAGNVTTKTVQVSITERTYTDEDLNERIDALLASIITPDMDETQKARAIYDWVKGNIVYTGKSDKTNFNKAAIEGLLDLKGDCFTNSCICVAALKRLGMDAMIVKKVPIISMYRHWWLMAQVDGNWYHIDTCPRTWDKPDIFLWTESQLSEYSAKNTETHNYDRSLYPAVTP